MDSVNSTILANIALAHRTLGMAHHALVPIAIP